MIIDLEKVKKLEKKYQNDNIALSALESMVNLVSTVPVSDMIGSVALSTLISLEIVKKETENKLPDHLNS